MGQKVNPISLRLGYIKGWDSSWFANKKNLFRQINGRWKNKILYLC